MRVLRNRLKNDFLGIFREFRLSYLPPLDGPLRSRGLQLHGNHRILLRQRGARSQRRLPAGLVLPILTVAGFYLAQRKRRKPAAVP